MNSDPLRRHAHTPTAVLVLALTALATLGLAQLPVMPSFAGTMAASLSPSADSGSSGVRGVAKGVVGSSNLYGYVDDGTSYAAADNDTTHIETLVGTRSAFTMLGFPDAHLGTVTQVVTHIRARRTKFASGTVQLKLYDGPTLLATRPAHALGTSYSNFDDVFSGLAVADASQLRARVEFANNAAKGSLLYTELWASETGGSVAADLSPTVSIGQPVAGSTVAGPVDVSGSSWDDVGVSRVEVQIDGAPFQPATGTGSWTYRWDSTGMTGSHLVTARATDSAGQVTSQQVTVTVGATSVNPLAVSVSGNRLVGPDGSTVRLLGVNRSGTQYACIEGWGFFDGPTDSVALGKIKAWGASAVRVSLNEDCWLGINGVSPTYGGVNYQAAIESYVSRLNAAGLRVILDLHWNAPGSNPATDQQPMADRDHAPSFWHGVSAAFKDNPSVVFDLYNEPHPDSNRNTAAAWTCVQTGGTCPGVSFVAAGMQELLDAVRSTGARNVVMVGGPQYAGTVDKWAAYAPVDPIGQLAASVHIYYNTPSSPDWSPCYLQSCWDTTLGPLALSTPIVIGEIGEHDCAHGLIDGSSINPVQKSLLDWSDAHGLSYLSWSWIASGNCAGEPALISNYDGTPTAYGVGLRDHLLGLAH